MNARFGINRDGDEIHDAITTCHYQLYLRSDEQALVDTDYCYCVSTKEQKESDCGCYDELKVWLEA